MHGLRGQFPLGNQGWLPRHTANLPHPPMSGREQSRETRLSIADIARMGSSLQGVADAICLARATLRNIKRI